MWREVLEEKDFLHCKRPFAHLYTQQILLLPLRAFDALFGFGYGTVFDHSSYGNRNVPEQPEKNLNMGFQSLWQTPLQYFSSKPTPRKLGYSLR